jgi:hypothetical protein
VFFPELARAISFLEDYIWWITGASLLSALAALMAIPWVTARLPEDYFLHQRREVLRLSPDRPALAFLLNLVKNVVGAILLVLGLVLLFTPGQGLLTILMGLLLMNFPGKYRLERWLVQRRGVLAGLNWLRRRHGQAPFRAPEGLQPESSGAESSEK